MAELIKLGMEARKMAFLSINDKADRIMVFVVPIYFLFGVFLSFFHNTYAIAIGVGGLCIAFYFLNKMLLSWKSIHQYVLSSVLAVFSAQFIYQMHGLFEMHFFFFVSAIFLVAFRNWKLFIPMAIFIVAYYALFAWLQYKGIKEIYFTQLDHMNMQAFLFQVTLTLVMMGICGYWSYDLELTTLSEAKKITELEKQVANMTNNIDFADEISKGNLNANRDLLDVNDALGKSLLGMQESLKISAKREQEEKFITVGITKVGDIIRKHGNDPEVLANEFIKCIVKYTNLNQGGLFLQEEEEGSSFLKLTACYAYERRKFLNKRIEQGEGLVGQCFLEKEPAYLTVIPNDYIKITSGLGSATPSYIYIQPIKTTDEIVGVLELASFNEIRNFEKQFIERAAENIASAIISSRTTQKIKLLLTDEQQRAEEMKAQEEEMRQNMEELQATQEEIGRKQMESESRIKAINESGIASIEFAMNGIILDANDSFLKLMGYSLNEIQGKHHRIFVSKEYVNSEEYRKFWEDLGNGIPRPGEYQRISKSGEKVFIKGSYSIISDLNGKPSKVLKLATDITLLTQQAEEMSAQEEELRQNMEELQTTQEEINRRQTENESRIKAIDESGIASIEFALDGTILEANESFLHLMGYSLNEIQGKQHSIFVDKQVTGSEEYRKFWEDLGNGIPRPGEYQRVHKSGKKIFIKGSYSIIRDQSGKPIKILKLATDITRLNNQQLELQRNQSELLGTLNAVNESMAVIEFNSRGEVQHANSNFLKLLGYEMADLIGKHHSLFVLDSEQNTEEYANFWKDLASGKTLKGDFKRVDKRGKIKLIRGNYTPIKNKNGEVVKIIKIAYDISEYENKK
jgi:methyl-accepting chemotaxis protein